ncbi:MAG: 3-keto-5-aminohexanoate cleavage protein [Burkholderiaceae bacterium]|jgi:3-keto-5-aminohexanoate cleavage enzyme|nr:3-keto-5-aminohexanoate cleavage protein [Burkholderiaceae bacterium]NDC50338.1 3-keto-5-aminohexanoate cleavage protein [Burkholderiaceae bacterium]NDC65497.1 3-keto-5-aminohexanoate cleavage protein [Burkholderiaceae bacterium]NDF58405.1 3-keto-5-aminohexanoate cleavage protein [Burkholderiaceae bacterium]NDH79867.1 3-keto-5-aminohexanoate cleavage protein [Burkholderiaceae bacterium]
MNQQPVIITVAITGAVPRKKDCPGLPVTPTEQIEETHKAYEAGASLVHIHVRNPDETPSSDPDLFAQVQEGVQKHCPDMIIQFSTGGRGRDQSARGSMLFHRPDMASLATGSTNFPVGIYENPTDFVEGLASEMLKYEIKPEVEIFDLAMLYNAANLVKKGLLLPPPHVQFVMGVPNAMPVRRSILEFLIKELKDVMPNATWTAAGIGKNQLVVNEWALELGGHVRTGLEDNIRFDETRLAKDNAELVGRLAKMARDRGRPVATGAQARQLLGLRLTH